MLTMLQRMQRIAQYFEHHAETDASFAPEAKAAHQILELLAAKTPVAAETVAAVQTIIQTTESSDYYNGSGWLDFKMHVRHFLELRGFEIGL